ERAEGLLGEPEVLRLLVGLAPEIRQMGPSRGFSERLGIMVGGLVLEPDHALSQPAPVVEQPILKPPKLRLVERGERLDHEDPHWGGPPAAACVTTALAISWLPDSLIPFFAAAGRMGRHETLLVPFHARPRR